MFDAAIIEKSADGTQTVHVGPVDDARLPDGDVTVRVEWSTLNYKDALAITGRGPIVRQSPMVPGIDFAGVVETSSCADLPPGTRVVLNGWGVGERWWGGLAGRARVKGEWLVKLPDAFTTRQAMAIGTAGYTAMLCVMALERQGLTGHTARSWSPGPPAGWAASPSCCWPGWATTSPPSPADRTRKIICAASARPKSRRARFSSPGRPLEKARWAGAVDAGGVVLANICAAMLPEAW
jgi:acrylyl-CoA reductase (NADPH)